MGSQGRAGFSRTGWEKTKKEQALLAKTRPVRTCHPPGGRLAWTPSTPAWSSESLAGLLMSCRWTRHGVWGGLGDAEGCRSQGGGGVGHMCCAPTFVVGGGDGSFHFL